MKGLCIFVSVLSVLAASEAAAAYKTTTFKSAKAPRETIENYEEVVPIIAKEGDSKPYPVLLWVTILTKLENFTLVLHMNHDAVPPGFSSMYYNEKGELVKDMNNYDNCYYHGSVEGHPKWTATMAACNGLQGEFGLLSDTEQFYHIEPLDQHNSEMEQVHVVYKDKEYKIPQGRCGTGNHSMKHHLKDLEKRTGGDSQYRMKRQSSANIVEWVVVNDRRQYVSQGSNLTATVQRAIAIANSMGNIYSAINIRIALVNSVTFTDSDKFTIVSDSNTLLNSFTSYVQNSQNNVPMHDSVMLLTGIDLTGSTVGIAFVGAMCGSRSVGLTQDGGRSLTSVVSTAAHELGHIFDMNHYNEISGCTCSDPNGCVMRSISSGGATIFSPCSVTAVTQFLQSPTFTNCLSNNPSTTLEGQRCGNGIVEQGETCDCGEPAHCRNPCCNPNTCQLSTGSQCAVGQCCNTGTCQFLSSSTVCRSRATTDCDIAEICTGNSADCPADVTVVDGTSCLSNTGYCFRGQCPRHSAQCLAAWNSQDGFSACYNFNRQGSIGGNCGHVGTTYTPCSVSNIRCGQLQCREGTYQNIYNVAGGTRFTLTTGSGNCNSYGIQLPSDVMNPGLVLDGTKCDTNMVCQAQQCKSISDALNPLTCPTGTNGQVCSGSMQGICNNLGQCSCLSGFVPPNCETATAVNECNTNNGGCSQLCTDTTNSFTCSCRFGYTLNSDGRTCNDINECTSGTHNCAQNCNNNAGGFTCTCNAGYNLNSNGRTCDDINECNSGNGGCSQTCTNTLGSFQCSCTSGYQLSSNGRSCVDIDECTTSQHNCDQLCRNSAGGFICDCNSGYTLDSNGRTCTDINECNTNNGGCSQVCNNRGGSFTCSCNSGFTLEGGNACQDINECASSNGGCSQVCTNTNGSFVCSCNSGYRLSGSTGCTDINECQENTHNCQQTCQNTAGGFTCNCNTGYILDVDSRTCNDINECSSRNGGCTQTCTNTAGSFTCSCQEGFRLASDQRSCVVIDQCSQGSDNCDQFCMQTGTTVTCSCQTGYSLAENGRTCNDIDECATSNGNCAQICSNNLGSFACLCNSGYILDADGRACNDINECADSNGGCGQVCSNSPGSFSCGCRTGYMLSADGITCVDIDECQLEVGQSCQDTCVNSDGSYTCACHPGFALAEDGRTCRDIDECQMGRCSQICTNTEGSFECSCRSGYVISTDGFSCDDINECRQGDNGGCEQLCVNSVGSYTCSCTTAFELQSDGRRCNTMDSSICQDVSRCSQFCHRVGNGDICSCRTGYSLADDGTTCTDINECTDGSDSCQQICSNIDGGFNCSCEVGLEIAADMISCRNITFTGGENQATNPPSSEGGVPVGAIVGGLFGGILVVVLLVLLIVGLIIFRSKRKKSSSIPAYVKPDSNTQYNPPTTVLQQMSKSSSAEDLLDDKPVLSHNAYESDDSFEEVEPATYGNVTFDPVLDKHVPKRKQAPPPPSCQAKRDPSLAPPRHPAPTASGEAATANGKPFLESKPNYHNIDLQKKVAPIKPGKPPANSATPSAPSQDQTPSWVKTTQELNTKAEKSSKPTFPPTKPVSSFDKPTPPWVKTNAESSEKPAPHSTKPTPAPPTKPLPPTAKPHPEVPKKPAVTDPKPVPHPKPQPPSRPVENNSNPVPAPKPVALKPTAPKPVAPKPNATEAIAPKPTAPKPTAPKPTALKPVATKPTAPKPTAPKPTALKPVAPKPAPRPGPTGATEGNDYVPAKRPIAPPRR